MTLPTAKTTAAQLKRAQFAREIACPDKRYWCEGDNATVVTLHPNFPGPIAVWWDHDGRRGWVQVSGEGSAGKDENGNWLPALPDNKLGDIDLRSYLTEKSTTLSMQRYRQKVRAEWVLSKAPADALILDGLVRGSPAAYKVEHTPFGIFAVVWRSKVNTEIESKQHPLLPDFPGDPALFAYIGGIRYALAQDKKTLLRSGINDPDAPQDRDTTVEQPRRLDHPERPDLSRLIPGRDAWYTISPAPNGRLKLLIAWPDRHGKVKRVAPSIGEDGAFVFCDRSYILNSLGEVVKNDRY